MSDSCWKIIACLLLGFVGGFIFLAIVVGDGRQNDIKAGYFNFDGKAYKIERITP